MIKIGILTFHRSINYGAFMQCYSLSKRLQQDFPDAKVEVIDYATEHVYDLYKLSYLRFIFGSHAEWKNTPFTISCKKAILRMIQLIRSPRVLKHLKARTKAFEYSLQYLPLSEERYVTDDYIAFFEKIKGKYDIVIVGSDAVWEFIVYPFPNAYFMSGEIGAVKMSYAACSSRMHISKITKEQQALIHEALSKYEYLGIRDVSTHNFLSSIDPTLKTDHNCDPTIFLDLDKLPVGLDRVKNLLESKGIDLSKPIIGVMGGEGFGKLIREMFGKKYQIVAVYASNSYADCYLPDLNALEWSQIFSLFSITFTRFFHGTILSLKNLTPTITLDPWRTVDDSQKTKIKDLYDRLDLTEHYFLLKKEYTPQEWNEIKERAEFFIHHPDKEKIRLAIEKESKAYDGLYHAITNVINNGD